MPRKIRLPMSRGTQDEPPSQVRLVLSRRGRRVLRQRGPARAKRAIEVTRPQGVVQLEEEVMP